MVTASRALIDIVSSDVELFTSEGFARTIVPIFEGGSFEVKVHVAGAVSVAFCKESVGQFVVLTEAGLGELLLKCVPEGQSSPEMSVLILSGLYSYLRVMKALANGSELFAKQVAENEDFCAWMHRIESQKEFALFDEWRDLSGLVPDLAQIYGIKI
jgi:hypothetical protein